jgi:hypothetical protein
LIIGDAIGNLHQGEICIWDLCEFGLTALEASAESERCAFGASTNARETRTAVTASRTTGGNDAITNGESMHFGSLFYNFTNELVSNTEWFDASGVIGFTNFVSVINMQVATANTAMAHAQENCVVKGKRWVGVFLKPNVACPVENQSLHVVPPALSP